jgi:hypothetical protein
MREAMTSRRRLALLAMSLVLAASVGVEGPANAAARTYADCTSMHRVYANGTAKSATAAAHPSPSWIKIKPPAVDSGAYTANRKLDRDNDGIACEVAK